MRLLVGERSASQPRHKINIHIYIRMRILELFSGTGSVGSVFGSMGWEVVSLDLDPKAEATITADIREWDFRVFPKVIST